MRKQRLGSRALRCAKTRSEGGGPAGGGGWGTGAASEGAGGRLPRKEPSRGRGRSPAPSADPRRLDSRGAVNPGDTSLQVAGTVLRGRQPCPEPRGCAAPPTPPPLRPPPRPAQRPRRVHLRGAPVAELVGDGLDAPGPGHRDVAALRAHVQPHHRHGRLSVRCFPPRPRAAPAGSGRSCLSVGRPGCPGTAAARRGGDPEQPLRSSAEWLDAPRALPPGARLPTQNGRSQLLSLMYRTDQNFPESAAFTHRRLRRPLHVPLPLPSSRAFSAQCGPGPRGDVRRCHGDRSAAPALLAPPAGPPAHAPPAPAPGAPLS